MSNELSIFNADSMGAIVKFSELMAQSVVSVPAHLRGKPADCMAIAMQAQQWGMNPYAVAQKTHIVNGNLGYESQLVNAVISSSRAIVGRFKYEYVGDWSKFKVASKESERGLGVRVGGVLAGDSEITWGAPVYLENITTRNSPLWKTAPQQQISYLALKYWARLYTPDVILGVYDHEELATVEPVEKDITPVKNEPKTVDDLNAAFSNDLNATPTGDVAPNARFTEIEAVIISVTNKDQYKAAYAEYQQAWKNGELTESERQELATLLGDLYKTLK